MDAMEALDRAQALELAVGLQVDDARVECYAVPLRPGPTRSGRRFAFLIVTDADERAVREALTGYRLECMERRGRSLVLVAFASA